MDIAETCRAIAADQRARRFAIKQQSRLMRSLESFVRINFTAWSPDLPKKEADAENAKALALIEAARKSDDACPAVVRRMTLESDRTCKPWDDVRDEHEASMEGLARTLPVWSWCQGIKGFAGAGKFLAIIVAETTTASAPLSLSSYEKGRESDGVPDERKKGLDGVYSRLGLAPYGLPEDGGQFAGSTWRKKLGPRTLTDQEWIDHPFSAKRYAEMFVIIDIVLRAQTIGKQQQRIRLADGSEKWFNPGGKKAMPDDAVVIDEGGETHPNGPYGEVYCNRRARTALTHPDWTPMHARRDAQRVALKALLADLYAAWMRLTPIAADGASSPAPSGPASPPPRSAAPAKKAA